MVFQTNSVTGTLLDRLIDSGDATMRMIGAWHVIRQSFRTPAYASEADQFIEEGDQFIEEGDVYRRFAAEVAAHVITSEEFRERAEGQLVRFFNDEDEQVRKQAADVFREIEPNDFARFSSLADVFLASRAFENDACAFLDALRRATSNVCTLVISAAEKIVGNLEVHGGIGGHDLYQLQGLLQREYSASENTPELRRRLLDVIDMMVEKELYGTDDILKTHERE